MKTYLLLVMRNGTRGSIWPLTNNPRAKFNQRNEHGASNLDFPLWKLLRASCAAPGFFPSEELDVHRPDGGRERFEFIDGGVGPYNNPALAMFLQATLPAYQLGMKPGFDCMQLVSIGVGHQRLRFPKGSFKRMHLFEGALQTLLALMDASSREQDKLCRILGACKYGAPLDLEIGDLLSAKPDMDSSKQFAYYRYDHELTESDRQRLVHDTRGRCRQFGLDKVACMRTLLEIGRNYAREHVVASHFPAVENAELLRPWLGTKQPSV